MNLHNAVRGSITSVAQDLPLTLYTALGTFSRDYETMTNIPNVRPGVALMGQVQSIKADDIIHAERITYGTIIRRIYLRADPTLATKPSPIYRPLCRAGDYIDDDLGQRWQVDAVLEDFSHEGWMSVQAIMQQTPQALHIVEEGS